MKFWSKMPDENTKKLVQRWGRQSAMFCCYVWNIAEISTPKTCGRCHKV